MRIVKLLYRHLVLPLAILLLSMAVHEYGHLTELQKLGVPIEEFSIGIGPKLFSHKTVSGYEINLRPVPIMAYVAPTLEGSFEFRRSASLKQKIRVDFAGVRNNFILAMFLLMGVQLFSWKRGIFTNTEFLYAVVSTPAKVILRFFSFILSCITLGKVNLFVDELLISTGYSRPNRIVRGLIQTNLILLLINVFPLPPILDGGHIVQDILVAMNVYDQIPNIPFYIHAVIFGIFTTTINYADTRMLDYQIDYKSSLV